MAVRKSMRWLIGFLRRKVNDIGPVDLDPDTKYLGDTIRLSCTFYDLNGSATNPTSPSVSVWDPEGKLKVDSAPTTSTGETGGQYYDFSIPDNALEGTWRVQFQGTIGELTSKYSKEFQVRVTQRIWSDDELQQYLDMHRTHVHREKLSSDASQKLFYSKFGMFEDDVTLYADETDSGIQAVPEDLNLVDGVFVFNSVQSGTLYLDGKSYDINSAIAECFEELAGDPNKAKSWSRGDVSYTQYDLMEMAKYHRNLAGSFKITSLNKVYV